jgi:hypothetical protein
MDGLKARIRGGLESRRGFFCHRRANEWAAFYSSNTRKREIFGSSLIIFFLLVRSKCSPTRLIFHTHKKGIESKYLCPTIGDQNRHTHHKGLSNQKEPRWMNHHLPFIPWRYKLKLLFYYYYYLSSLPHCTCRRSCRIDGCARSTRQNSRLFRSPEKKQGRQI